MSTDECIAALRREVDTLRRAVAMLTLGQAEPEARREESSALPPRSRR